MLAFFHWSCASYLLDETQETIRKQVNKGDYALAITELEEAKKDDIYKDKDRILWLLEMGMLHHYNEDYLESNNYFQQAEIGIEQAFTKSISRGAYSLIGNDNQLVYDSEPYEEFYLHAFKALNYLKLKDTEASLVEIRQMVYKIDQLNIRLNGLADTYSKQDTSFSGTSWEIEDSRIQNSPFARYLASQLFESQGNLDAARIEKEQFIRALHEHYSLINQPFDQDTDSLLSHLFIKPPLDRDSTKVLAFIFTGISPIKIQEDLRIYNEYRETELKVSLPKLYPQPSHVSRIEIWNDQSILGETILLESIETVAEEVYRSKLPIIYGRSILRSIAKYSGTKWVENIPNEDQKFMSELLDLASFIYKEGSEKADLRSWASLSGNVYVLPLYLPTGNHRLFLKYYNDQGTLIHEDSNVFDVEAQEMITIIESHLAY